jgi:hypothetical protein
MLIFRPLYLDIFKAFRNIGNQIIHFHVDHDGETKIGFNIFKEIMHNNAVDCILKFFLILERFSIKKNFNIQSTALL